MVICFDKCNNYFKFDHRIEYYLFFSSFNFSCHQICLIFWKKRAAQRSGNICMLLQWMVITFKRCTLKLRFYCTCKTFRTQFYSLMQETQKYLDLEDPEYLFKKPVYKHEHTCGHCTTDTTVMLKISIMCDDMFHFTNQTVQYVLFSVMVIVSWIADNVFALLCNSVL